MLIPAPAPRKLSDEQIDRLLIAIQHLKGKNAMAAVIAKALEKQPTLEYKRSVLVMAFAQSYELLLIMNMAVDSDVPPMNFRDNLKGMDNAKPA